MAKLKVALLWMLAGLAIGGSVAAQEPTPAQLAVERAVELKLAAARNLFKERIDAAAKPTLDKLEALEKAAKKKPDVKEVIKLMEERERFSTKGESTRFSTVDFRKGTAKAMTEMKEVYDAAIRDLFDAGYNKAAIRISGEWEAIRKDPLAVANRLRGGRPEPESMAKKRDAGKTSRQKPFLVEGDWYAEGDAIVAKETSPVRPTIVFGDPSWQDYDMTFDIIAQSKPENAAIIHWVDTKNFGRILLGGATNKLFQYDRYGDGKFNDSTNKNKKYIRGSITLDNWHQVKVEVRGPKCRVLLDAKEIIGFEDPPFIQGRVGIQSLFGGGRFRRISVKTPDGVVLWDGLPELK